jgi:hypothetical protein
VLSCSEASVKVKPDTLKISKAQQFFNKLKDSLTVEYAQASSKESRETILEKYHERLQNYLMENYIDSIYVTVDEILIDGWKVTTRLSDKDIEFKYSLTFDENMSTRADSVYKFMLALEPGTKKRVNFSFMGASQINPPNDSSVPTFRIFAFPIPLEYTEK